ncbi:ribose-phosphate pyrophosphokinase [Candidatus Sumerlaeota bacterium]|nr:ribose-phosphate pyrophosphokinase [Candidatus Sumerlaeota bacterium]
MGDRKLVLLSGRASASLSQEIAEYLSTPLGAVHTSQFSDGEIFIKIEENVRGADVYIIQSTHHPSSDHIIELCLMIDACRRASAERINAVIPYFGYARQDRKTQGRVPLSAKVIANMISGAGADRVITCDLHTGQIQGFFDIPVDHLYAGKSICNFVKEFYPLENAVVVSPDVGNVKRSRSYAMRLNLPLAIIDKRRQRANQSEVMHVVGDVAGKTCYIFDDMIDTGGTICNAVYALVEKGAKDIYVGCTHAVFSGSARENLGKAPVKMVFCSNTIPQQPCNKLKNLQVISVAPLLGETLRRVHLNQSVSELFGGMEL